VTAMMTRCCCVLPWCFNLLVGHVTVLDSHVTVLGGRDGGARGRRGVGYFGLNNTAIESTSDERAGERTSEWSTTSESRAAGIILSACSDSVVLCRPW